jgi:hypothetical protein
MKAMQDRHHAGHPAGHWSLGIWTFRETNLERFGIFHTTAAGRIRPISPFPVTGFFYFFGLIDLNRP